MSEAKQSTTSNAKTGPAPKGKGKAESSGAAPKAKDGAASTPAASADAKAPDGAKGATDTATDSAKESGKDTAKDSGTESGNDAGKSARDSIGGKADAHYGYFSSVRTPAYRSGWDTIWGNDNGSDGSDGEEAPRPPATRPAAKTRKRRDPITVTLDLDELPPALRDGLVEIARAELRKSRVSYARRDKAGAVDWRITCRVD